MGPIVIVATFIPPPPPCPYPPLGGEGGAPATSNRKHTSDDEDGGDEDDGSNFDGSSSDGSASEPPESVHSSGSDSVQNVPEGQGINSDGKVVEEGDCPTTDDESERDSDSEVVWAKSARGDWRIGHTFGDKLYLTWDIPEENWIPRELVAPTVPKPAPKPAPKPGKQPAAKLAAASSQRIESSACLNCVPDTISIYARQRVSKSNWQPTASK